MMSPDSKTIGLVWKETRQLLPLGAILVAVGVGLILIWDSFMPGYEAMRYAGQYVPLILPALFAVGAGAVLVGQEKEQKTLWWLATFPVSPWRVISVKFGVALAGLLGMWIGCWLLATLGFGLPNERFNLGPPTWMLFVQSIYILACGFYTSWRFQQSFAGVLAIVPLAVVPIALVGMGLALRDSAYGPRFVSASSSSAMILVVTVSATIVMSLLAYRAGLRSLRPAPAPRGTPAATSWRDAWRPSESSSQIDPFRYSIASLLWQSIHHNRGVLGALMFIAVAALLCIATYRDIDGHRQPVGLLLLGYFGLPLAISWLGVFSFTGDGSVDRIRFLAERGVSPTKAWIGRHLVGISLSAVIVLGYAVVSMFVVNRGSDSIPLPSVALFTLIALVFYGVSQWISQLLRLLASTACVAPVVSLLALYWLGYAAVELGAPLVLLVFCAAIPLFASWAAMRRYMDGRFGIAGWSISFTSAIVFAMLPTIPFAIRLAQFPRMSDDRHAALWSEAAGVWRSQVRVLPIAIHIAPDLERDLDGNLPASGALEVYERRAQGLSFRLEQNSDSPGSIDQYRLMQVLGAATVDWLEVRSNPASEARIESAGTRSHVIAVDAFRERIESGDTKNAFTIAAIPFANAEFWSMLYRPVYVGFASALFRSESDRRFTQTAVAIRLFHRQFQRWPADLSELAKVNLAPSQAMASSNAPFGYQISDDGTEAQLWTLMPGAWVPPSAVSEQPPTENDLSSGELDQVWMVFSR